MWFPTIWHFDKCRLPTSLCSLLLSLETPNVQPSLSYHLSLRPLFCLFLCGCLRQVLLYTIYCRLLPFSACMCILYCAVMNTYIHTSWGSCNSWIMTLYWHFIALMNWFLKALSTVFQVCRDRFLLGWTSTKQGLICHAHGTTQWRQWGSNPQPFDLKHTITEPLRSHTLLCKIILAKKK